MGPHPSALASPDTGPTERVDVTDDDRSVADESALDGPTVATAAVTATADEASERGSATGDEETGPIDEDLEADPLEDRAPAETRAVNLPGGTDPADEDHEHGACAEQAEPAAGEGATGGDEETGPGTTEATAAVPMEPGIEDADPTGAVPADPDALGSDHADADHLDADHADADHLDADHADAGHDPATAPVEHTDHPAAPSTTPVEHTDGPDDAATAVIEQPDDDPVGASTGSGTTGPDAVPDDGPMDAGTVPVAAVSPVEPADAPEDDTTAIPVQEEPRRRFLRTPWVRRGLAALAAVVVVLALVSVPSLVHARTRPGSDTTAARLAEWGRDHGLGPLVTWAEARQYDLDQPATGGAPAGGIPLANGAVADHPGGSPAPPPLPAPAGIPPLPGEGQWQTVVSTPHGDAVRLTTVRPDAAHTSFLVGVLWMDPTLVKGVLHPGTEDPGGDWSVPTSVDDAEQRTVVSAFSAGFRLQGDSHGGWYLDDKEARPLVPGAASLVIHKNGTTDVGAWGTEVRMSPDVAAVRQNLIPLVDHGVVDPTCATGGTKEWGSTVGQAAYINRSAFGVTASGAEIYVGGPALSVCTLGDILRSAGAVRGMELDINPAWVSGAYFHPTGKPRPDAFQLFPGEQVGAQHYLQTSGRDFVSFDLRALGDATGAGSTAATSQHGGKHPGSKHH